MIIDKHIGMYLAVEEESIREGLRKIEANEHGVIFCVTAEGHLQGVLTDGDFRRWVVQQTDVDLERPISEMMNTEFQFAYVTDREERIQSLFSERINFVPLVDEQGRCVAIARRRDAELRIGDFRIGKDRPTFVIAEIGNNHNGSLEMAKRLVDEAVAAGADCVKFQMRDLETLYKNAGNANDATEDLGTQYTLDLLAKFQLPNDQMLEVFDYCVHKDITPLCTPWDVNSLQVLEDYGMSAYKAASADLTNHDLLEAMARTGKPLICSTGMSTEREITDAVALLRSVGSQYALLHCNSTYPAPFKDVDLAFMGRLRGLGKCPVGYSSHDRGINVCIAAVGLGADIIEKHFTLDRTLEGNDHRVSLLPGEFAQMVEGIRQVEQALGGGEERRLSQGELMNRESLGKSLVINQDLSAGEIIRESMIEVRSPGRGLAPYRKKDVIGKAAQRDLKNGDILFEADITGEGAQSRNYSFNRPFGIPVRYHDLNTLGRQSNFDLLEFHLSYKDIEENIADYFDEVLDMDVVVHAPELFEGDHTLDLCSLDPDYRRHSIDELKRVVDVAVELKPYFKRATKPGIIVNAGGFTQDAPLPVDERKRRYDMILEALAQIDTSQVDIWPQTMPPFPWHFGGQRIHNLFMDADEIAEFCAANDMRVCFDTSHSKLACTHFKWSFTDFIHKIGQHIAHIHIADARGVDGEGLQIDEGDIAFAAMGDALNAYAPQASFIPEIWQGHKNGGEGFWIALERLEKYLAPKQR